MQRADFVFDAEVNRSFIVAGRLAVFFTDDQKAGGVAAGILNVIGNDVQAVEVGGQRAGNSGTVTLCGHFGGQRGAVDRIHFHAGKIFAEPATALADRFLLTANPRNFFLRYRGQQIERNRQIDFRADFQRRSGELIEGVRNRTFDGVFDRHDTVVGGAAFDRREHIGDGADRMVVHTGAEFGVRRLMREGGGRSEIGDLQIAFQRQRRRHNFAVDGARRPFG